MALAMGVYHVIHQLLGSLSNSFNFGVCGCVRARRRRHVGGDNGHTGAHPAADAICNAKGLAAFGDVVRVLTSLGCLGWVRNNEAASDQREHYCFMGSSVFAAGQVRFLQRQMAVGCLSCSRTGTLSCCCARWEACSGWP